MQDQLLLEPWYYTWFLQHETIFLSMQTKTRIAFYIDIKQVDSQNNQKLWVLTRRLIFAALSKGIGCIKAWVELVQFLYDV